MSMAKTVPGQLMAAESAEALGVFCRTATAPAPRDALSGTRAIYTIARGSSDAAANILSYEIMRELGIPVTSLPPSVFSIGDGVALDGTTALVISQSGASDDLVRSARGAVARGAKVIAITNQPASPVDAEAQDTVPIAAGPERAVPATKTVIGSIAAGAALLGASHAAYAERTAASVAALDGRDLTHPEADAIRSACLRARHIYVIGRDTGYGAAHEVALKLKECCALHAEAYSASEVLHGPLQLATNPLLVILLDTAQPQVQDSLDKAEARFRDAGCDVLRIRP